MKMTDINTLSETDVLNKLEELRKEQFDLRIQKATSGIEKSHRIQEIKTDIARLKTHQTNLRKKVN